MLRLSVLIILFNIVPSEVNKKLETTHVCCALCLYKKISFRKPLVEMSHIQLFCFRFNISYKQNINLIEVFHVKPPV